MDKAFERLAEYTGEQWGMVTARQAKSLGVDGVTLYRLKDAGFLDAVRRGVYVATTVAVHRNQAEQAAWLALRPDVPAWDRDPLDRGDGVLSHGTAARLHGVGELADDGIAFIVPRRRTSRDTDLWFKIDGSLTEDDVTLVDGLPVTTVLRTICDLLDQHIDASHVATIIREAVHAGQLRLDTLADRITPYARGYRIRPATGAALLEYLLEHVGLTTVELAARPRPGRAPEGAAELGLGTLAPSVQAGSITGLGIMAASLLRPDFAKVAPSFTALAASGFLSDLTEIATGPQGAIGRAAELAHSVNQPLISRIADAIRLEESVRSRTAEVIGLGESLRSLPGLATAGPGIGALPSPPRRDRRDEDAERDESGAVDD